MEKLKIIVLFISILVLSACEPKRVDIEEETLSTDIINVPSTASGVVGEPGSAPIIVFNEEKHDFGEMTQGEKVSYSFVFKNTGGTQLVISAAQGSCGCTVPTYPKNAIKSGETSKIDVVFDSYGKSGIVEKTVTLVTNCNPSTKVITISAKVIVPETE